MKKYTIFAVEIRCSDFNHIDYKIIILDDYIQKPPISCILIGGFSVIYP